MANPKDWTLESDFDDQLNANGSVDSRKWEFWAVSKDTGEIRDIDTSPYRNHLPVEEWLLHCALDFPRGPLRPLTLEDLNKMMKEKEKMDG